MDSDEEAELQALRNAKQYGGRQAVDNVGVARGAIKKGGRQKSESEEEYAVEDDEDEATAEMKKHFPMKFGKIITKQHKGDAKLNFEDENDFLMAHAMQARKKEEAKKAAAGSVQVGRKGGIAKDIKDVAKEKEGDASSSALATKVGAIGAGEGDEDESGDEGGAASAVGAWKGKKGQGQNKNDTRKGADIADDDDTPLTHEVRISAFKKSMTAIGLDPAGSRMVCGDLLGSYKFYDFAGMNEGKQHFREMSPVGTVRCEAISFCPSGGMVLCISADCQARVYDRDGSTRDAATRHYKRVDKHLVHNTVKGDMYVRMLEHTKGHTQVVVDGVWNPLDNNKWLTCSIDGSMRLWDLEGPVSGMGQELNSMVVMKTQDARGICVGGVGGQKNRFVPYVRCI